MRAGLLEQPGASDDEESLSESDSDSDSDNSTNTENPDSFVEKAIPNAQELDDKNRAFPKRHLKKYKQIWHRGKGATSFIEVDSKKSKKSDDDADEDDVITGMESEPLATPTRQGYDQSVKYFPTDDLINEIDVDSEGHEKLEMAADFNDRKTNLNNLANSIATKSEQFNAKPILPFNDGEDFLETKSKLSLPKKDYHDNGYNGNIPKNKKAEDLKDDADRTSASSFLEKSGNNPPEIHVDVNAPEGTHIRTTTDIKPIKDKAELSFKVPLACSYYNQHCDGGYPELVARHAFEFGLPDQTCDAEAQAQIDNPDAHPRACGASLQKCYANRKRHMWFARGYGYVGGFYGKCSELRVMQEVLHRGPVAVAIEAGGSNFNVYAASQHGTEHHQSTSNDRSYVDVQFKAKPDLFEGLKLQLEDKKSALFTSDFGKQYFLDEQPGLQHDDVDVLESSHKLLSIDDKNANKQIGVFRVKGHAFHDLGEVVFVTSLKNALAAALGEDQKKLEDKQRLANGGTSGRSDDVTAKLDPTLKGPKGSLVETDSGEDDAASEDNTISSAVISEDKLSEIAKDKLKQINSDMDIISFTDKGINAWEFVDHAVAVVGWGETPQGVKYWIVRNSWGSDWGPVRTGYAYLRRGDNDLAIETQVIYSDPDFSRGRPADILRRTGLDQRAFWKRVNADYMRTDREDD